MDELQAFELFQQGMKFGLSLTLLTGFVPASLRAVWSVWNIVR